MGSWDPSWLRTCRSVAASRGLGFTPRFPARRVAERDEQAVARWREATWAEVRSQVGLRRLDLPRGPRRGCSRPRRSRSSAPLRTR
nr:winged helix-turn-helix domain-containing protein [Streptomyces sp. NA02950]